MAFLGRYGHQSVGVMLHLPVTLLGELSAETSLLLEGESDQMQQSMASGGGG